jgi:hypothetical protein
LLTCQQGGILLYQTNSQSGYLGKGQGRGVTNPVYVKVQNAVCHVGKAQTERGVACTGVVAVYVHQRGQTSLAEGTQEEGAGVFQTEGAEDLGLLADLTVDALQELCGDEHAAVGNRILQGLLEQLAALGDQLVCNVLDAGIMEVEGLTVDVCLQGQLGDGDFLQGLLGKKL